MFVGGDGRIIHTTCWMWYIPLEEAQIGGVSGDVINYMVSWSLGGVPRVCATASACLPACLHFHSLQHSDFVLVVLSFTRFCSAQKWT